MDNATRERAKNKEFTGTLGVALHTFRTFGAADLAIDGEAPEAEAVSRGRQPDCQRLQHGHDLEVAAKLARMSGPRQEHAIDARGDTGCARDVGRLHGKKGLPQTPQKFQNEPLTWAKSSWGGPDSRRWHRSRLT